MEGCQLDWTFKGLDVLPLMNSQASAEAMAGAQRLRLNGRVQFDGRLQEDSEAEPHVYAGVPSCSALWN